MIDSLNRRGLSAVRPEINAKRGAAAGGRSSRELVNVVPYLASASSFHSPNSIPASESAPPPKNQGSMT